MTDRNVSYFRVVEGNYKLLDKVVITIKAGEATLLAGIGFVPELNRYQFSPTKQLGVDRAISIQTLDSTQTTPDKTLYVTVIGVPEEGMTVFEITLVGQRDLMILGMPVSEFFEKTFRIFEF